MRNARMSAGGDSQGETHLARLLDEVRACRICVDAPLGSALPHEPRPVLQISRRATIAVCGQAPGIRVHKSGRPFTDPSGVRLRNWMGISEDEFYDMSRVAIVPMGFCFPGVNASGGDLPPRKECALTWHDKLFKSLREIRLMLLVGRYAQEWHLHGRAYPTLTETVRHWRDFCRNEEAVAPRVFPLPHPSWRNSAWLKSHPWFTEELIPELRKAVRGELECRLLNDR